VPSFRSLTFSLNGWSSLIEDRRTYMRRFSEAVIFFCGNSVGSGAGLDEGFVQNSDGRSPTSQLATTLCQGKLL
jgi:hypothetical protein